MKFSVNCYIAANLLRNCHFQGCFPINKLPDFKKYPASYLIHCDHMVWYAVIRYSENEDVVLFNPAPRLIEIEHSLLTALLSFSNVTVKNINANFVVQQMFGTCLYFIWHCISSLDAITTCFPVSSDPLQHTNNIVDFLKCKDPLNFNRIGVNYPHLFFK